MVPDGSVERGFHGAFSALPKVPLLAMAIWRKMQNTEYQLVEVEFFKPITHPWQCGNGGFLPDCRAQ